MKLLHHQTKAPKGYHKLETSIKSKQCLNFCKGTSFIISVGSSDVAIMVPWDTISLMKWYLASMCLVLLWYIRFLVKCMMLGLSQNTTISSYCQPRSSFKPLNQIATFTAFVPVVYSISIVDKTIVNCNVTSQLMAQLFLMCCLFGLNILIQIQKVFYWILKCVMV